MPGIATDCKGWHKTINAEISLMKTGKINCIIKIKSK